MALALRVSHEVRELLDSICHTARNKQSKFIRIKRFIWRGLDCQSEILFLVFHSLCSSLFLLSKFPMVLITDKSSRRNPYSSIWILFE